MLQLPGKHIVYAFSDPAGANACMAMAKIGSINHQTSLLFSNKKYESPLTGIVQTVNVLPDLSELKTDCLFTGTSHPKSSDYFEVNCITQAKKKGVRSVSFVDHWVNFSLRFLNEQNETIYPDEIWVVDETAKEMAIKEGLPFEKLVVSGNPYHYYLRHFWKPSFDGKSYLKSLGISISKPVMLFAPDPLSLRNGKEITGFTEDEALQDIIEVLSEIEADVELVLKCHPLQLANVFDEMIDKGSYKVHLLTTADTLELIKASDVVIGFYSNMLLEAEALGSKVVRYFPGKEGADLLKHKNSLPVARNKEQLQATLKHCIHE